MNLEDKINAPIPTVDPLTKAAADPDSKRRKGDNAGTLAIPRKAKKPSEGKRKGPKKALVFDGSNNGLGLADLVSIRSDTAMARVLAAPANDTVPAPVMAPVAVAPSAAAPDLVPTVAERPAPPVVETPAAVVAPVVDEVPAPVLEAAPVEEMLAPVETPAAATASAIDEAPAPVAAEEPPAPAVEAPALAEPKSSVFMVATLQINEPAPPAVETTAAEVAMPEPVAAAPSAPVAETSEPARTISATVKQPRRLAIPPAAEEPKAAALEAKPVPVEEPKPAPVAEAAPASVEQPKTETATVTNVTSRLSRSEAIARAARANALSGAKAAPSPEAILQAARAEAEQRRAAEQAKQPADLYGYWTRAKNGRRFPARGDFDAAQLAENWPNSMLLTCGNTGSITQVLRLGAGRRDQSAQQLNFTSMITEWILTIGGEAARVAQPVQDTETFVTSDGSHDYRIVALPLGDQQSRVDHVLCQLTRQ